MRDPVLIHLHVPKCAGGAVNQVMRAHFGERLLHASGPVAIAELSKRENHRFDAVVGHLNWGVHAYFARSPLYLSAVREPVDRVCSFFNHMHTQPRAEVHRRIKTVLPDLDGLDDATFEQIPPLAKRWCNSMCRIYTGYENVNAMDWHDIWPVIDRRLRSGRLVVRDLQGITRFLAAEGIHEGPLPKQKVTRVDRFDDYVVARPATLKPATVDRIRALNGHDLRLMDALREAGYVSAA